MLEVLAMCH